MYMYIHVHYVYTCTCIHNVHVQDMYTTCTCTYRAPDIQFTMLITPRFRAWFNQSLDRNTALHVHVGLTRKRATCTCTCTSTIHDGSWSSGRLRSGQCYSSELPEPCPLGWDQRRPSPVPITPFQHGNEFWQGKEISIRKCGVCVCVCVCVCVSYT